MVVELKLFDTPEDAVAIARRSRVVRHIEVLILAERGQAYLKQTGGPSVEPTFLCADGRWRRYDLIPELPHSEAGKAVN